MASSYHLKDDRISEVVEGYLERAVLPLLRSGVLRRRQLAVAVAEKADPSAEFRIRYDTTYNFQEGPLENPYDAFAEAKCLLAYRTEMSTREVALLYPTLLLPGDIVYPGGIYYRGIAVGVSGVDNWDDERFAFQIAVELWAAVMTSQNQVSSAFLEQ